MDRTDERRCTAADPHTGGMLDSACLTGRSFASGAHAAAEDSPAVAASDQVVVGNIPAAAAWIPAEAGLLAQLNQVGEERAWYT